MVQGAPGRPRALPVGHSIVVWMQCAYTARERRSYCPRSCQAVEARKDCLYERHGFGSAGPHAQRAPSAPPPLGQVYKGRLHTGEQVAVKVQRPFVLETVTCDLYNPHYWALHAASSAAH